MERERRMRRVQEEVMETWEVEKITRNEGQDRQSE